MIAFTQSRTSVQLSSLLITGEIIIINYRTAVGNLGPAGHLGPTRLNLMARDSSKTLYYGARVLVIVIQNGPA